MIPSRRARTLQLHWYAQQRKLQQLLDQAQRDAQAAHVAYCQRR